MRRSWNLVLALTAVCLLGLASAQDATLHPTFETLDGDPYERDGFGAGDVVALRVDVRNTGDVPFEEGDLWVAFPPVERATLFGNSSMAGFSFPDRMIDENGDDVMVDHGEGAGLTQLYALEHKLEPGETGSIRLRVTVLSSTTDLGGLLPKIYLMHADGSTFGVNEIGDRAD